MRGFVYAALVAGALVGCTEAERTEIRRDVIGYNRGTPMATEEPTPSGAEVAIDTGLKAAGKAQSPADLIAYAIGLVVTITGGWAARRYFKGRKAK